jgi:hypothetical protein
MRNCDRLGLLLYSTKFLGKREGGRGKREEGRTKREERRRKREEGRTKKGDALKSAGMTDDIGD